MTNSNWKPVPRITAPDAIDVLRRVATSDVLSDRSGVMFIHLAVDRDVWDEIACLLAATTSQERGS